MFVKKIFSSNFINRLKTQEYEVRGYQESKILIIGNQDIMDDDYILYKLLKLMGININLIAFSYPQENLHIFLKKSRVEYIFTLGMDAKNLFFEDLLGVIRGKFFNYDNRQILCTFAPYKNAPKSFLKIIAQDLKNIKNINYE